MNKSIESPGQSTSQRISEKIATLGGWRGDTLGRMRKLIGQADPDAIEEWKWMGTPRDRHPRRRASGRVRLHGAHCPSGGAQ